MLAPRRSLAPVQVCYGVSLVLRRACLRSDRPAPLAAIPRLCHAMRPVLLRDPPPPVTRLRLVRFLCLPDRKAAHKYGRTKRACCSKFQPQSCASPESREPAAPLCQNSATTSNRCRVPEWRDLRESVLGSARV